MQATLATDRGTKAQAGHEVHPLRKKQISSVVRYCCTNKLVMLYHRVGLAELGVRLPTLAETSSAVSGQYAIL